MQQEISFLSVDYRVYSVLHGWGTVIGINHDMKYSRLRVKFDSPFIFDSYCINGKRSKNDLYQELYYRPPKVIGEYSFKARLDILPNQTIFVSDDSVYWHEREFVRYDFENVVCKTKFSLFNTKKWKYYSFKNPNHL